MEKGLKCFLPAGRQIPRKVLAQVAWVFVLSLVAAGGPSGGSTGPNASPTASIMAQAWIPLVQSFCSRGIQWALILAPSHVPAKK